MTGAKELGWGLEQPLGGRFSRRGTHLGMGGRRGKNQRRLLASEPEEGGDSVLVRPRGVWLTQGGDHLGCEDALRSSRSALASNMRLRLGQSPGCGGETGMSTRGAGPGQGAGPHTKAEGGGGQEGEGRTRPDRAWSSVSTVWADGEDGWTDGVYTRDLDHAPERETRFRHGWTYHVHTVRLTYS